MPRGRPPKPHKDAPRPKPRPGIPACPAHLSAAAKAKWKLVIAILKEANILTLADVDRLAEYCEFWATWDRANADIVKRGEVFKGPQGGDVQNPYLSVRTKAADQMRKYSVMLGLDPASRQRLVASEAPAAKGGKSRFFDKRERE